MSTDIIMVVEDGKEMKGECQDSQFPDSIQLQSWSWDFAQRARLMANQSSGGSKFGEGLNGRSAKDNSLEVTDLTITKYSDLSTIKMMSAMFGRKTITKLDIYTRKLMKTATGMIPTPYIRFTFTNARFSTLDFSDETGETLALEEWKISFEKLKITYTQQANQGMAAKYVELEWTIPGLQALRESEGLTR